MPAKRFFSSSIFFDSVASSPCRAATYWTAGTRLRAAMSSPARTSSLTAFAFAPGALNTGTPRRFIAGTGMLFVPAPARPIAFTESAIVIACMSADRTRIASGRADSFATA